MNDTPRHKHEADEVVTLFHETAPLPSAALTAFAASELIGHAALITAPAERRPVEHTSTAGDKPDPCPAPVAPREVQPIERVHPRGGNGGKPPEIPPAGAEARSGDEGMPLGVERYTYELPKDSWEAAEIVTRHLSLIENLQNKHAAYADKTPILSQKLVHAKQLTLAYTQADGTARLTITGSNRLQVDFTGRTNEADKRHYYRLDRGMLWRLDTGIPAPLPAHDAPGSQPTRKVQEAELIQAATTEEALQLQRNGGASCWAVGSAETAYLADLAERAEPEPVSFTRLHHTHRNREGSAEQPTPADSAAAAKAFEEYVDAYPQHADHAMAGEEGSIEKTIEIEGNRGQMLISAGRRTVEGADPHSPYVCIDISYDPAPAAIKSPPGETGQIGEGRIHMRISYQVVDGMLRVTSADSLTARPSDTGAAVVLAGTERVTTGDILEASQVRNFLRRPSLGLASG